MISELDLYLMVGVTILVVLSVMALMRAFDVLSFDSSFAVGLGFPVELLNAVFFGLLAFAVVISLQAVGIVLVSAMLITPAATAYLLTNRLRVMMLYAVLLGCIASVLGWWISSQMRGVPPGPMICLVSALIFIIFYFFAPVHGVLSKLLMHLQQKKRVMRENILKSIYHWIEKSNFSEESVSVERLSSIQRESLEKARTMCRLLVSTGEATWEERKSAICLTPVGWRRAAEIVRNHRLWELYLTDLADYDADHVHDDAEKIEHVLSAEMVRQLEKDLDFPTWDPHGKPIPTVGNIYHQEGLVQRKGGSV